MCFHSNLANSKKDLEFKVASPLYTCFICKFYSKGDTLKCPQAELWNFFDISESNFVL